MALNAAHRCEVMKGQKGAEAYLDDVDVFDTSAAAHLCTIRSFLARLQKARPHALAAENDCWHFALFVFRSHHFSKWLPTQHGQSGRTLAFAYARNGEAPALPPGRIELLEQDA